MDGNWWEKVEKFKLPIALSFVGVVLIMGGMLVSSAGQNKDYPKESLVKTEKTISVDVSGAIKNAGVYILKEGDRIEDAILAGGGFSETANQEYISKYLNLAQKLSDGSKVYIPFEGDSVPVGAGQGGGEVAGVVTQSKVNINTASLAELEALPGIGPVTASKIISDRPYQQTEELLGKKIVSKSVFEKIKDSIIVY
ncbi:helix-hairpin-helix domain-containing protein [Candidatus Microgenomates bacterium]|nr:helix-hairpin-helix domain-containing protein [Candidatus Microgenomates bacterium]